MADYFVLAEVLQNVKFRLVNTTIQNVRNTHYHRTCGIIGLHYTHLKSGHWFLQPNYSDTRKLLLLVQK
jgi:hypothetical protein